MPRSDLVCVRVEDLEPGRRVRMPRARRLVTVVSVTENGYGSIRVLTEDGDTYLCCRNDLVDAEECSEVCP